MWKVWKVRPISLRDVMPDTAAFVDLMREAFGADVIDASIRAGLAGETTFCAQEAGRTVGAVARCRMPIGCTCSPRRSSTT